MRCWKGIIWVIKLSIQDIFLYTIHLLQHLHYLSTASQYSSCHSLPSFMQKYAEVQVCDVYILGSLDTNFLWLQHKYST